jgi:hypothetical protein
MAEKIMAMHGASMDYPASKGTLLTFYEPYDGSILPTIFKLVGAYCAPDLRRDLREKHPTNNKRSRPAGFQRLKGKPIWEWGSDRVLYIRPSVSNNSGPRARHRVRAALVSTDIKNVEKYRNYAPIPHDKRPDYYRIMKWRKAHWRGGTPSTDYRPVYRTDADGMQPWSRIAIAWLKRVAAEEGIHIQHAQNEGELRYECGDSWISFDGYCKETNTVYEFHGDYWHGNPKIYDSDEINSKNGKTMGELYRNTVEREEFIRNEGFNLVVMWESDYHARKPTLSETS